MTRDKVPALPLQHDDTNRDHSMAEVQALIEEGRARYDQHPFLASLDRATSVEDLRAFVPKMYFYVFAFQDMLRLSDELIRDPALKTISTPPSGRSTAPRPGMAGTWRSRSNSPACGKASTVTSTI